MLTGSSRNNTFSLGKPTGGGHHHHYHENDDDDDDSYDDYFFRPGYGAPRDTVQKENLMKMLHYPADTVKHVRTDDTDVDDKTMYNLKGRVS